MMNMCLVINTERLQIFGIRDVDEDQRHWLGILSEHIPDSSISPTRPAVQANEIHYGVFSFHEFKQFMESLGYSAAVSKADLIYTHQMA
jgi:hypothetical protein